jgi:acetoin utilization deacetylase AcuC-like enzyme
VVEWFRGPRDGSCLHLSEGLWSRGFGEGHPLRPERLKRTYDLLTAYRAFDAPTSHLVEPRPATRDELLLFHAAEYVDAVECVGYLARP